MAKENIFEKKMLTNESTVLISYSLATYKNDMASVRLHADSP